MKLHMELHKHPIAGPGYEPAWEFAEARKCPVLLHGGGDEETVVHVERVASKHPAMKLTLAHLGPNESYSIRIAKACPNVYFDTALSISTYGQVERMAAQFGAQRLLYGSDATYLNMGAQLTKILMADLSDSARRQILSGTFRALCPGLP
jgi:uncharacterized protein